MSMPPVVFQPTIPLWWKTGLCHWSNPWPIVCSGDRYYWTSQPLPSSCQCGALVSWTLLWRQQWTLHLCWTWRVDPVLAMASSRDSNMALNSTPLELSTQSPHEADLALKSPVTKTWVPGGIDLTLASSLLRNLSYWACGRLGVA